MQKLLLLDTRLLIVTKTCRDYSFYCNRSSAFKIWTTSLLVVARLILVLWGNNKTFLGRIIETSLCVSCKTFLRRRMDEPMWRRNYVSLRSCHNIPQRHPVLVRSLGDAPLRRRWVFHLRLVWDVLGTYPSDVVTTFLYDIVEPSIIVFNWSSGIQFLHFSFHCQSVEDL